MSPQTEKAYTSWVRRYVLFHNKCHPNELGEKDVDRFLSWLMASLLYGAGLRLSECCKIRVKDIDFTRREISVRDGKGRKDRVTVLPQAIAAPLSVHIGRMWKLHRFDLKNGYGRVALPDAYARKNPGAEKEWAWQWVFPASRLTADPRTGKMRRYLSTTARYTHVLNKGALGVSSPVDKRMCP
jgi:integrase